MLLRIGSFTTLGSPTVAALLTQPVGEVRADDAPAQDNLPAIRRPHGLGRGFAVDDLQDLRGGVTVPFWEICTRRIAVRPDLC